MADTAMLFGVMGGRAYEGRGEVLSDYFPSAGLARSWWTGTHLQACVSQHLSDVKRSRTHHLGFRRIAVLAWRLIRVEVLEVDADSGPVAKWHEED